MKTILDFLVNNYVWFLIISLILVFALIGYLVDAKEKRTPKLHFGNDDDLKSDISDSVKTMKELLEENSNSDVDDSNNSTVLNVTEDNSLNTEEQNELPQE